RGIAIDSKGTFVYTADASPDTNGFVIDRNTGGLMGLAGSPYSNGAGISAPWSIAADPLDRFLYVVNASSTAGITGFVRDTQTGTLQIIGGQPFAVAAGGEITADPRGQYVVEADFATAYTVYSINQANGVLTA